jgi:ataxia telangiectasia mutated family protein
VNTLTAEVVHIDFGIVYEQGKGLQTPETVPFRLTRDIVDGFGVTGIEGTFRQSCIQTLQVLRDHASSLLTILEVIIHDPLYKWKVSPLQARKRQAENRDEGDGEGEGGRTAGIVAKTPVGGSGRATGKNTILLKAATAAAQIATTTTGIGDSQDGEIRAQSTFGRDAANRTIARIRNKLQGHEDPTGEPLGVEGQVEFVLCEAMSPQNLSKLFQGWSAWL